jgi:transcriptional regulator with XRE-family HTH domain
VGGELADGAGRGQLAGRLRDLRSQWPGIVVTQRQLAEALGVSVPLISSWESATSQAFPSESWLQAYARFFATRRSMQGDRPRLLELRELTAEEERVRRGLIDELVELREAVLRPSVGRRQTGALGGKFYYFPDGQPVRIISSRLSPYEVQPSPPTVELLEAARRLRELIGDEAPEGIDEALTELDRFVGAADVLRRLVGMGWSRRVEIDEADWNRLARGFDGGGVQYSNPWHPNAIHSLWNGDMDAVIELHGHVRAENPGSDVRWLLDSEVQADDLTAGHVIILGGTSSFFGTMAGPLEYLRRRVDLPVRPEFPIDDLEYGGYFEVSLDEEGRPDPGGTRRETHAPRFLVEDGRRVTEHGEPLLEYDVGLLLRAPNPLNLAATVTVCTGIFSRGTYGLVRALTDPHLRARNEKYLAEHHDMTNLWMLVRLPVFTAATGAQTITPDLTRPFHRLRTST